MRASLLRRAWITGPICIWLLATAGCTHRYTFANTALSVWPVHERLPLTVNLVLTEQFSQTAFDKEVLGDHFIYPLGPLLAANSETLAKEAFASVIVSRGAPAGSQAVDGVLTPSVAGIEQSASMWAFEEVAMTVDLTWTLTDPAGKILWVRTVRGQGKYHLGNAFTHESAAPERVNRLMADLFPKSLMEITTAPELRALRPAN